MLARKKISLLCDEASDCGHHEELSGVVTYVCYVKNRPVEVFVTFGGLENQTAIRCFLRRMADRFQRVSAFNELRLL